MITFYQKAERFPPILVRLLARKRWGPPLTSVEISDKSGIPVVMVEAISMQLSWDGIDLPTMQKFLCACGVDLENSKQYGRIVSYLATANWKYLRTSGAWETYYMPMIKRYRAHVLKGVK